MGKGRFGPRLGFHLRTETPSAALGTETEITGALGVLRAWGRPSSIPRRHGKQPALCTAGGRLSAETGRSSLARGSRLSRSRQRALGSGPGFGFHFVYQSWAWPHGYGFLDGHRVLQMQ